MWAQNDAIELARLIEERCPAFGYHVALTGGLLYKIGLRKDADLLFYSIRQATPDRDGLIEALKALGVTIKATFGWMAKAEWAGKPVDIFFPETPKTGNDSPYGAA